VAKKVYITIESDRPHETLDSTLDNLQTERGVTYAEGSVGRGGTTKKRRYAMEKLFTGVQPEDYALTSEEKRSLAK
jgi:hypothetical protein